MWAEPRRRTDTCVTLARHREGQLLAAVADANSPLAHLLGFRVFCAVPAASEPGAMQQKRGLKWILLN